MRPLLRGLTPLLFASVLASPLFTTGCAVHARVYDPYYHDYHAWAGEGVYYDQWEHETHHEHKDFKERDKNDQKAYWDWRHSHPDQH
jgi:hypothetical protein